MGQSDEPKMDELKKLLRRLDGLDGNKGLAKKAQKAGEDQRGYVGALRGAPVPGGEEAIPAFAPPAGKPASNSGVFVAAAAAALISTVTVYLMMSSPGDRGAGPGQSSDRFVPSKLEFRQPAAGGVGSGQRDSTDTAAGLVRSAELLLEKGDVEAARALLQQAAELGSGPAALRLGRSYDPAQAKAPSFADRQSNPALAKAWYERALALGTQEAAAYISDPSGR